MSTAIMTTEAASRKRPCSLDYEPKRMDPDDCVDQDPERFPAKTTTSLTSD